MTPDKVFIVSTIATLIVALANTYNKEKIMVQESGEMLPTSSYVFLVVRHLLLIGVLYVIGDLFLMVPQTGFVAYLSTVGLYLVAYVASFLLEVVVRFIVSYSYFKAKQKKVDNHE